MAAPVAGRYVIGARLEAATGEVAVDVGAIDVDVQIGPGKNRVTETHTRRYPEIESSVWPSCSTSNS